MTILMKEQRQRIREWEKALTEAHAFPYAGWVKNTLDALETAERDLHDSRNTEHVALGKLELAEAKEPYECSLCENDLEPADFIVCSNCADKGASAVLLQRLELAADKFEVAGAAYEDSYQAIKAELDAALAAGEEMREALSGMLNDSLPHSADIRDRAEAVLSQPPSEHGQEIMKKARKWDEYQTKVHDTTDQREEILAWAEQNKEFIRASNILNYLERETELVAENARFRKALEAIVETNKGSTNHQTLGIAQAALSAEPKDVEAYRKQHKTDWERIKRLQEEAKNIELGDHEIRIVDQKAFRSKVNVQKAEVARLRAGLVSLTKIVVQNKNTFPRDLAQAILDGQNYWGTGHSPAALAGKPKPPPTK